MTTAVGAGPALRIECLVREPGAGNLEPETGSHPSPGDAVWVVYDGPPALLEGQDFQRSLAAAAGIFSEHPEVATVSVAGAGEAGSDHLVPDAVAPGALRAGRAALPLCFLNGAVTDLIGFDHDAKADRCARADYERWIETATRKGLVHVWLNPDRARPRVATPRASALDDSSPRRRISLGIDAAWLLDGESGAQVFAFELVSELAGRPEIERILLLSDSGAVPNALAHVPQVSGVSWPVAMRSNAPLVDILHRPYQVGVDVDFRRYSRVARFVALTVLDFIAYDNPAYHESEWSWRQYQRQFDEGVCLADRVFAISGYVGTRLQQQFADRLAAPARAVPLGTDHLRDDGDAGAMPDAGSTGRSLANERFLFVLGNDFEHKNRDFAVRVFSRLRDRGYTGLLVMAGFHLDRGSSFDHELSGAGGHASHVVRIGAVTRPEKTWLLRHADAVLYPTSSEGFGLVPFEAAALGTPTAFVRFGPLRETLPGVGACSGWQLDPFVDHVLNLIADPDTQLSQIRAAGASLTWASHVDQLLDAYQGLLRSGRARGRRLPGAWTRLRRTIDALAHRVANRIRRMAPGSASILKERS